MDRWVGKVAFVTGVSSGIGYGLVKHLVKEGLVVIGLARRSDKLQVLQSEISGKGQFHPKTCDITNTEELKSVFDWVQINFGGVDVLINNAGMVTFKNVEDVSVEDWKKTVDTNLLAMVNCTKFALETMRIRGDDGVIINMNSTAGHYIPPILDVIPATMYVTTKHAMTAFTKCIIEELQALKSNIKVTSLSPGLVMSEISEDIILRTKSIHLLAEDIAEAVAYILSRKPHVHVPELTIMPIQQILR